MRKIIFLLVMALVVFSSCSRGKAVAPDAAGTPPDQTGNVAAAGETPGSTQGQAQESLDPTDEAALRVKAVALRPEAPTALDNVTATPTLADSGEQNVKFLYQWFVNGKEVMGINGATLENNYYKKGAWLYCRVKVDSEDGESEFLKSDVIRVLNSLPVLNLPPLENFPVPGDISYQASASDVDNDALTFEVLAPKEEGLAIDPKTGLVSWKIDAGVVARLGETIEIKLAVSDGEGQKVTGTVTLKLTSTKQTTSQ